MHTTKPFRPGMFNLHTTGLTDPRHLQPLEALIEPRIYGASLLELLGEAALVLVFFAALLVLFFFT